MYCPFVPLQTIDFVRFIRVELLHRILKWNEMARDEARHGKAFEGLLKRYFG